MAHPLIVTVANDKSDAFNKMQLKYFSRYLGVGEQVSMTREQFQVICNDIHEYGRIRERATKSTGALNFR